MTLCFYVSQWYVMAWEIVLLGSYDNSSMKRIHNILNKGQYEMNTFFHSLRCVSLS